MSKAHFSALAFISTSLMAANPGDISAFFGALPPVSLHALDQRWTVTATTSNKAFLRSSAGNTSVMVHDGQSVEIEGHKLHAQVKDGTVTLAYPLPSGSSFLLYRASVQGGNQLPARQAPAQSHTPNIRPAFGGVQEPSSLSFKTNTFPDWSSPLSTSSIAPVDQKNQSLARFTPHCFAAVGVLLAGCQSNPPVVTPQLNAAVVGIEAKKSNITPFFVVRSGDGVLSALRSLGLIDKKTYILAEKSIDVLPGTSAPIYNVADLVQYFEAYGYTMNLTSPVGANYARVMVAKTQSAAKTKANTNCKVTVAGAVPMGPVISDIAEKAGIDVNYADTGATAYAGVVYPVNYKGPCSNALEYLGRKSDLTVSFNEDSVEYRMMDTAAIDIGVPLQERKVTMDILASGGGGSGSGAAAAGGSSGSSGSSGGSSGGGGSKSMQSTYVTNYAASIKSILDSTKTPFGTWHYVPETGQIFIRDRADVVAVAKASINRMAQAFQSRFEITLTLYRMTVSKDRQINGSLSGVINQALALNFGLPNALPKSAGGAVWTDSVSGTKSAFQILSEWGAIETLDSYSLTLQAGIPQTMKVANNTEYVRNISSTTTGTTGAVTSTIEQANATDGSFITMQARQTEAGKIAVDYGVFINRLDGFDTTQTQSSVVKSQRGFERTFDTMAVVDDGIPYIASVVSQKSRNDKISTLPGLEEVSGIAGYLVPLLAGNRGDASAQTYIVVMVEAKRQ